MNLCNLNADLIISERTWKYVAMDTNIHRPDNGAIAVEVI